MAACRGDSGDRNVNSMGNPFFPWVPWGSLRTAFNRCCACSPAGAAQPHAVRQLMRAGAGGASCAGYDAGRVSIGRLPSEKHGPNDHQTVIGQTVATKHL